jgi:hypothetical protein
MSLLLLLPGASAGEAPPSITGSGVVDLDAPAISGSGLVIVDVTGTGAITIRAPSISASGTGGLIFAQWAPGAIRGYGAITVKAPKVSGEGEVNDDENVLEHLI